MLKQLILFGVAGALVGCSMVPKYERPASPVPGQFPEGSNISADAADIQWRDFFADAQLKSLVELALQNNRDLRVAALNVERYEAQYRIQRSALFSDDRRGCGIHTIKKLISFFPAWATPA